MNKKEKIEYLNQLYNNNLIFGGYAPFGCLFFDRIEQKDKVNFVIVGYNKFDCEKSIFIDGVFFKIGDFAFKDNQMIEEIILGLGVYSIGEEAFSGCTNLKRVVCRQSLVSLSKGAFKNCKKLESIQFGGNLQKIDDYAFEGCSSLKSISLGSNVNVLGKGIFKDCISLHSVFKYNKTYKLQNETFYNCKNLKELNLVGVRHIGCECFKNSGIERIYVNHELSNVETLAFDGCLNFKEVVFLNYSVKNSFSILTSGGNSYFSDAVWIAKLENGTSFVIERKSV